MSGYRSPALRRYIVRLVVLMGLYLNLPIGALYNRLTLGTTGGCA